MRGRRAAAGVALAVLASVVSPVGRSEAGPPSLPSGFADRLVAAVPVPTAVAFTPDGRILVTSQSGTVHVIASGDLVPAPALDLTDRTCSNSERGMLGIAVDPNFRANGWVYVFYTHTKDGLCPTGSATRPDNRVSRFTMSGNVIDPATERVVIDGMPSYGGNHNAGDVKFGRDGYLYVTIGDGGCDYAGDSGCQNDNDATRDPNVLVGKLLRVTKRGEIPASNPFTGPGTARCNRTGRTSPGVVCQEIYAFGLRNPFRMAADQDSATVFVNDVGGGQWEEIDRAEPGADYGWNVREGPCATGSETDCGPPPARMTNPVHAYSHDTGCHSITGGAFVPDGVWPAQYDDDYLYADFGCDRIFALDLTTGDAELIGMLAEGPTTLAFGRVGRRTALYYTTYANGGEVRRVTFTG